MISLEQIREDLRDIRYYYAHKDVFDRNEKSVGVSIAKTITELYFSAFLFAILTPTLFSFRSKTSLCA